MSNKAFLFLIWYALHDYVMNHNDDCNEYASCLRAIYDLLRDTLPLCEEPKKDKK